MKTRQIFSNQSETFTFWRACVFPAKHLIPALAAAFLANGAAAQTNPPPPALKDAYKDHFYVGAAISRAIARGVGGETNKVNGVIRNNDELQKDIAVVKGQFNLVVPENDLKWERVHPHEGADGYDFGPADAFVHFGVANQMYIEPVSVLTIDTFGVRRLTRSAGGGSLFKCPANCAWSIPERFTPSSIAGTDGKIFSRTTWTAGDSSPPWRKPVRRRNGRSRGQAIDRFNLSFTLWLRYEKSRLCRANCELIFLEAGVRP